MLDMKWGLVLVPALLALCACQNGADPAVTVTTTQTVSTPAAVASEGAMCDDIRLQRDVNHTLAVGGYADDYSDTYNQMLDTQGCAR